MRAAPADTTRLLGARLRTSQRAARSKFKANSSACTEPSCNVPSQPYAANTPRPSSPTSATATAWSSPAPAARRTSRSRSCAAFTAPQSGSSSCASGSPGSNRSPPAAGHAATPEARRGPYPICPTGRPSTVARAKKPTPSTDRIRAATVSERLPGTCQGPGRPLGTPNSPLPSQSGEGRGGEGRARRHHQIAGSSPPHEPVRRALQIQGQ